MGHNQHFHTLVRPKDSTLQLLLPLDLVIIEEIPKHYYEEPETAELANYVGQYGLISYFMNEPFVYENRDHPGWVSPDGKLVYVLSRRVCGDKICNYDFWLEASKLKKIPFNYLIMNLFAEFPWQMVAADSPTSEHFVVRGMEQFGIVERILSTPYEQLVDAHNAAEARLLTKPTQI